MSKKPQKAKPGTPLPILGVIGHVHKIDVSPKGSGDWRYFGAGKHSTGQAHPTQEQAEADVKNWFEDKPVAYTQHAVLKRPPLRRSTVVLVALGYLFAHVLRKR